MKVELIGKTTGIGPFQNRSIDDLIVGQARVSSGRSEEELFEEPEKLLRHCILNQHFSILELANLSFKITTSRAIGRELLRHTKMTGVTEYSQRYSSDISFEPIEYRYQATSNRQSSTTPITKDLIAFELNDNSQVTYYEETEAILRDIKDFYNMAIEKDNIAKETARMILPECTQTVLYMNFRVRELVTFLNARLHKTAQSEIRIVAEHIRDIFIQECPIISKCFFYFEHAYDIHILDRIVLEKYKLFDQVIKKYES